MWHESNRFDGVKLVVKRGEVDWLHVVPSANWPGRMGTRLTKLCKIALLGRASGGACQGLLRVVASLKICCNWSGHAMRRLPWG